MPIYEYKCTACEHTLEKLQKMSDDPLSDCPECTKPALKKMVSAAGFRLKGKGWYETDFKSGNKKNVVDSAKDNSSKDNSSKDNSSKDNSSKDSKQSKKSSSAGNTD